MAQALAARLPEQRGNALKDGAGEFHQGAQHPAAKQQDGQTHRDHLGDETERHLVDRGGSLEDADNYADDEDDDDNREQDRLAKYFEKRARRNRILEEFEGDTQFSRSRLIDEDVSMQQDLKTMKVIAHSVFIMLFLCLF